MTDKKTATKPKKATMTQLGGDGHRLSARKYSVGEKEMTLFQRTYWLRTEDIIAIDDIKNQVLRRGDLVSLDLSAVIRGLLTYANDVRQDPLEREAWQKIVSAMEASKNPKRPGRSS